MRHKDKELTTKKQDNSFGIPKGLVARRREELIAAKILSSLGSVNSADIIQVETLAELSKNESVADSLTPPTSTTQVEASSELSKKEIVATRLHHPTMSRPKFEHRLPPFQSEHRPPTVPKHKSRAMTSQFFGESEPKLSEAGDAKPTVDWLKLLQDTISDAQYAYQIYYERGINTRQTNGWLSWWRHGDEGQKKAKEVKADVMKLSNTHLIMEQMKNIFDDPSTPYNNHSFASYLFTEFNKLLKTHGYQPQEGAAYDKNYWYTIAEQLHLLMPEEELDSSLDKLHF